NEDVGSGQLPLQRGLVQVGELFNGIPFKGHGQIEARGFQQGRSTAQRVHQLRLGHHVEAAQQSPVLLVKTTQPKKFRQRRRTALCNGRKRLEARRRSHRRRRNDTPKGG